MRHALIAGSAGLLLAACTDKPPIGAEFATMAAEPVASDGAPPLDADGVPRFRPGLYEVEETADGSPRETRLACLGEGTDKDVRRMLSVQSDPTCKVSRSTDAEGLHVRSACQQQGGPKDTLTLSIAGSDTRYRMQWARGVRTPGGRRRTTVMTAVGRRLGDCPVIAAPGEIAKPS